MSKEQGTEENKESIEQLPEVEQELSKVASNPKQNLLILALVVGAFLYLFFNLFFSSNENKQPAETPVPDNIVKPVQISADTAIPAIPTLPTPPKLEDPTPPPPPPPPAPEVPDITKTPPIAKEGSSLPALPNEPAKESSPSSTSPSLPFDGKIQSDEEKKKLESKRKSSIVLIAAPKAPKTPEQLEQETDFKLRGDMHLLLGRGKMIDAIIESAINTDFGGEIRAIINRDVYSEWGRNVLIPKGSRAFGTYTTGTNGAYGRVAIEWTRLDLTTGYTLNLSGTGIDSLGRKGEQGRVDNKFKERLGNAILLSAFNVILADTIDKIVKPPTSSQAAASQTTAATSALNTATSINAQAGLTDIQKFEQICSSVLNGITDKTSSLFTTVNTSCNTLRTQANTTDAAKLSSLLSTITSAATTTAQNSSTSTQPSKAQQASEQAFTDIANVAKELLEKQKFEPTITIDQGTHIKIYVNKDYRFPAGALTRVIK